MSQQYDVAIIGAGTGGCAAALAALSLGARVALTQDVAWIGGQLTSQAVPPDEHRWIERFGSTERYRDFRRRIRARYRQMPGYRDPGVYANPGSGWVSHLCFEPRLGMEVLEEQLAPFEASGQLVRFRDVKAVSADVVGNRIHAVRVRGEQDHWLTAKVFLDGTEEGDLLPLTGTEYVTGAESRAETGESHAIDGPALPGRNQGITWCAAIEWDPEGDHTIPEPAEYAFWRAKKPENWPLPLLSLQMYKAHEGEVIDFPLFEREPGDWFNLFSYRQIVDPMKFDHPVRPATILNWPQNDYYEGPTLDQPEPIRSQNLQSARNLTLSVIHWLQIEHGFRGLRLRPDLTGTEDGLAQYPYIRESRRIRAQFTLCEQHVSAECRPDADRGEEFADGVCIGAYPGDLHPSTDGGPAMDLRTLPFQIPFRALLPVRIENLLPAAKNLGVTHISNGCTRLHPVEWAIGEAAGTAAALSARQGEPLASYAEGDGLARLRQALHQQGVETEWPRLGRL